MFKAIIGLLLILSVSNATAACKDSIIAITLGKQIFGSYKKEFKDANIKAIRFKFNNNRILLIIHHDKVSLIKKEGHNSEKKTIEFVVDYTQMSDTCCSGHYYAKNSFYGGIFTICLDERLHCTYLKFVNELKSEE